MEAASTATGSSGEKGKKRGRSFKEKKMVVEDLDLVDFCLRAVGEVQAVQHMPTSVINVVDSVAVLQRNQEVLVKVESSDSNPPTKIDPSTLPKSLFKSLNVTVISTSDVFGVDDGQDPDTDGAEPILQAVHPESRSSIFSQNIRGFMENWRFGEQITGKLKEHMNIEPPMIELKTMEKKVQTYWTLTFMGKSRAICVGILDCVPSLVEMGYKNWILPIGDKIPLSSLKLAVMKTVPATVVARKMQVMIQPYSIVIPLPAEEDMIEGEDYDDESADPTFLRFETKKMIANMFSEKGKYNGLVFQHYVLCAELGDGGVYIVDPTGRQYGYEGENGKVIIHAELDDYTLNFPGMVVAHNILASTPEQLEEVKNDIFFPKLDQVLGNNLSRRICSYCGQLEGRAPKQMVSTSIIGPDGEKGLLYEEKSVPFQHCESCGQVSYCGKLCLKLAKITCNLAK